MDKNKEILFYKMLAFSFVGLYLYKAMKQQGGTLQGNPYGININKENIIKGLMPLINTDDKIKATIEKSARSILNKYIG